MFKTETLLAFMGGFMAGSCLIIYQIYKTYAQVGMIIK